MYPGRHLSSTHLALRRWAKGRRVARRAISSWTWRGSGGPCGNGKSWASICGGRSASECGHAKSSTCKSFVGGTTEGSCYASAGQSQAHAFKLPRRRLPRHGLMYPHIEPCRMQWSSIDRAGRHVNDQPNRVIAIAPWRTMHDSAACRVAVHHKCVHTCLHIPTGTRSLCLITVSILHQLRVYTVPRTCKQPRSLDNLDDFHGAPSAPSNMISPSIMHPSPFHA